MYGAQTREKGLGGAAAHAPIYQDGVLTDTDGRLCQGEIEEEKEEAACASCGCIIV